MRLNRLERALMNNPVRAASQRWIEAPVVLVGVALPSGARVLEIGCGRGVGLEILARRFPDAGVAGFDLDPAMVRLASARTARLGPRASVALADVERLPFADAAFDLVVEFGILHHVPGWRTGLREIARVLRPGGRFAFEDLTSRFAENGFVERFLDHPRGLAIAADTFRAALADAGLVVERLQRVTPYGFLGRARGGEP